MKTLRLFSLLACMILCGLTASAQVKVLQTPDEAEYFIKGDLNIQRNAQGEVEYTLANVQNQGIDFKMQNVFKGKVTDKEDVVFGFEDATTDYPGGFEGNALQYWRFDDYEKIWQPESEVRQGSLENTTNKYMNIMLVIDCSSSLGEDFNKVRSNTLYFIEQLFNASPYGNIRLGIIGFSSIKETQVFGIKALTSSTKKEMEYFIRNLSTHNGTALYHSMDRALEMLKLDTEQNIKSTEYLGSFLITFTDGIDQQSQNIDKDIFVAEDYYKYLKPILKDNNTRKKIYGRNIETRILSVKGNDITSARLEEKFDNDLMAICDTYKKMKEIAELQEEFRKISRLLIDRSMQLQCYVPMGFRGRVGWTFSSVKEEPVVEYKPLPKPKKPNRIFLGINAGVGIGINYQYNSHREDHYDYYYDYYYSEYSHKEDSDFIIPFSVGVDFAYKLTNKFSLGAYTSFGFAGGFDMAFGALTMFNTKNDRALMLGIGSNLNTDIGTLGIDARLGYKFKNNFYIQGEYLRSSDYYYYSGNENHYINWGVLIHFGYNIGGLF